MTAPVVRPDVARFVQDVRAALGDLAPDEVEDLTEGLTADVTDALGDADIATLGDPADYAAELRSAAGLPLRGPAADVEEPDRRPPYRKAADDVTEWLDGQTWWPATRDFLMVLRPCWWVLRGWVVFQLLFAQGPLLGLDRVLPRNPIALLVLLAFVVASVQIGVRSHRFGKREQQVVLVANIFLVLCLLGGLLAGGSGPSASDSAPVSMPTTSGLWANGGPVRDVFAYDGEGRLVPVVQLYDQDGRPLELAEELRVAADAEGRTVEAVPAVNAGGRPLWNVFPIRQQLVTGSSPVEEGEAAPTPRPIATAPPFRSVAPVTAPSPTPTPSPTASATQSPTASATQSPNASATQSPTGTRSPSR